MDVRGVVPESKSGISVLCPKARGVVGGRSALMKPLQRGQGGSRVVLSCLLVS